MLDRDKLMNANKDVIGRGAMAVIDRLQHLPSEAQVGALAVAFKLVTDKHRVRIPDTMALIGRLVEDASSVSPEIAAVRDYVRFELP